MPSSEAGRLAAARLGYNNEPLADGALFYFQKALGAEMINLYDYTVGLSQEEFQASLQNLGALSAFSKASEIAAVLIESGITPDKGNVDTLMPKSLSGDLDEWLRSYWRATPEDYQNWIGGVSLANSYSEAYSMEGSKGEKVRAQLTRSLSYELPAFIDKDFDSNQLRAHVQRSINLNASMAKTLSKIEVINRKEKKQSYLLAVIFTPLIIVVIALRAFDIINSFVWMAAWLSVIWTASYLFIYNFRTSSKRINDIE